MKVLSVIDSVDFFGKERANIQVARILKDNGHRVRILNNINATKALRGEIDDFESYSISYPRNIIGDNRWLKYFIAFFKTLVIFYKQEKVFKPDYIIVPTEFALVYLFLNLKLTKAKVIFRTGDTPIIDRKKGFFSKLYRPIWKHLIMKRVDTNVCISHFIANRIKKSGRAFSENDVVIWNIPPQRKQINDNVIYNHCSGAISLGFLGRIVPDKGVAELVDSVIEANENGMSYEVFIGGHVDNESDFYYRCILEKVRKSAFESRIHFLGDVNDLEKFFANIDMMAVPSVYEEPLSNVINEAKVNGRLSIIFNKGGMPELVEHLSTGYVCKTASSKCLYEALTYYYNNKEQIVIQNEKAKQSVIELGLTTELFAKKWLNVIK